MEDRESHLSIFLPSAKYGLINRRDQPKGLDPLALELPETLMTSWSFRGGLFEFGHQTEFKDLKPDFYSPEQGSDSDGTSLFETKIFL